MLIILQIFLRKAAHLGIPFLKGFKRQSNYVVVQKCCKSVENVQIYSVLKLGNHLENSTKTNSDNHGVTAVEINSS